MGCGSGGGRAFSALNSAPSCFRLDAVRVGAFVWRLPWPTMFHLNGHLKIGYGWTLVEPEQDGLRQIELVKAAGSRWFWEVKRWKQSRTIRTSWSNFETTEPGFTPWPDRRGDKVLPGGMVPLIPPCPTWILVALLGCAEEDFLLVALLSSWFPYGFPWILVALLWIFSWETN